MIDLSGIPAEDLLERLGVDNMRLTSGGEEINFSCFGGEHADGGSAYMNVHSKLWFCHGCKRSGTAVRLVMEMQSVNQVMAERWLRDIYGVQFDEPIDGSMVAETLARFSAPAAVIDPVPPPSSMLRIMRVDWAGGTHGDPQRYMLDRGFSADALSEWDIGYDFDTDRLSIPVLSIDSDLVGIKARAWRPDQQPKYLILGDRGESTRFGFQPYDASHHVFGLHRNRACRKIVLCEGELNAVALSQLGVERPVATGMSYMSAFHERLLIQEADEAVVFYDHGMAGFEGTWGRVNAAGAREPGIVARLEPYMKVRVVIPPEEDPAKLVELGRGDEALDLIENAATSLALSLSFG